MSAAIKTGRCPRCLLEREGNPDPSFGLSFAPPCKHCGYTFIPEPKPKLAVWVCPYCMKQHQGPSGHHVAGDDCATSCFHSAPGASRGVTQPQLVRIEVEPVEEFVPKLLPSSEEAA